MVTINEAMQGLPPTKGHVRTYLSGLDEHVKGLEERVETLGQRFADAMRPAVPVLSADKENTVRTMVSPVSDQIDGLVGRILQLNDTVMSYIERCDL